WTEGLDQFEPRIDKLGFALGPEMLSYHIHAHLDVYVDGKKETVPQYVGIDPLRGVFASLHTHDTTGIVHVEAARKRDFTLGQFFAVWGVKLTKDQLGPFSDGGGKQVRVFAGGKPVSDPFHLALTPHEEIAVTYGTQAQL